MTQLYKLPLTDLVLNTRSRAISPFYYPNSILTEHSMKTTQILASLFLAAGILSACSKQAPAPVEAPAPAPAAASAEAAPAAPAADAASSAADAAPAAAASSEAAPAVAK